MLPIPSRTLADPFEQLQRRIDCACNLGWILSDSETTATYPVDIREDGDAVTVEAELPGVKKDQIEVTFEQGVLNISASRETEPAAGHKHLTERHFTQVSRSFGLPSTVDAGKVQASLADGVLTLTLPKREEVKPRKIDVT